VTLPWNVDLVLGLNGYIWVSKHIYIPPEQAIQPEGHYDDKNDEINPEERERIARVCNVIKILAEWNQPVTEAMIIFAYESSISIPCADILNLPHSKQIVEKALELFANQDQL
jgi:exosome complex component RRP4